MCTVVVIGKAGSFELVDIVEVTAVIKTVDSDYRSVAFLRDKVYRRDTGSSDFRQTFGQLVILPAVG